MPEKLWKGRFTERTAQIVEKFTAAIDVDKPDDLDLARRLIEATGPTARS